MFFIEQNKDSHKSRYLKIHWLKHQEGRLQQSVENPSVDFRLYWKVFLPPTIWTHVRNSVWQALKKLHLYTEPAQRPTIEILISFV